MLFASPRLDRPILLSLALGLLPGCGAPLPPSNTKPTPTPLVVIPPPATTPDLVDPSIVSTTTLLPPKAFLLDGDIREWGSLLPESRLKPPGSFTGPAPFEGEEPPPPPKLAELPPAILRAVSHLAVALTGDSILVAAEIDGPSGDGLWLGLGTTPSIMPAGGSMTGWGNGFEEFECPEFVMSTCDGYRCPTTTPTPPDEMAACKKTLAKIEARRREHESRFRKLFRIEADGVKVVGPDGQQSPVPNAKVAWKKGAERASVELSLPAIAMPRAAEAPLETLLLVARIAEPKGAVPTFEKAEWVASNLPQVVSFEPYGDLRAALWAAVNTLPVDRSGTGMTRFRLPIGPSYQPGEPFKVETWEVDSETATAQDGTLFVPQAKLGSVEVGRAHVGRDFVVVLKDGKLMGIVGVEDSVARGVIARNRQLHVFNATPQPWSNGWYRTLPFWSVVVVEADGKLHEAIELEDASSDKHCHHFEDQAEIASKKLDRFGYSVKCLDILGSGGTIEVVHTWSERKKAYVVGAWQDKK